ncbi:MAG: glycosyltransferase family 2 protein [Vicingaceae bacterium]|nr:glycosyltransferase family 2 protein [Vicingaceae bacterium]
MKLSIIIVNYNVRFFLEQCLTSVFKAIETIDAEIFVVDNNSSDNSMEMVKKKFPSVKCILNKNNVGFSKANNQAIAQAKGEYVLLLNPDTVVEEDTFQKCITFSDAHPKLGGLGVKMVDGNGVFLPESKRGLPTPSVSFYKIFGFSALFPTSKRFSNYHLGYLNKDEINEIDVLSGAFMWMRKSVLETTGYLDEAFFMYGEDIDLSYRIQLAGYKNYYFPETKIIHYKGESTKKGSINYVFVFYNAMIIFSKKHFAKNAYAFSFFITVAIYLRASLAILMRFFNTIKLPLIDALFILVSLVILNFLKPFLGFPNQIEFSVDYGVLNVLTVIFSFLLGLTFSGGYSKAVSINRTLVGLTLGCVLFFGFNSLFPTSSSFSNKYISSIMVGVLVFIPFSRILLNYFNYLKLRKKKYNTTIIVGNNRFIEKISNNFSKLKRNDCNIIAVKENNVSTKEDEGFYTGKLHQLPDLVEIYNANEVIYNTTTVSYKTIIEQMNLTKNSYVDFKLSLNDIIVGSQTIEKKEV